MSGPYLWDPLQAYQDFVFEDQDPDRLSGKGVIIDKNAFVFHELFCEMTRAADNTWKNLYLAACRQKDGSYVLSETIWDLNYTFGDEFVWDPDHGKKPRPSGRCGEKTGSDRNFSHRCLRRSESTLRTAARWSAIVTGGIR